MIGQVTQVHNRLNETGQVAKVHDQISDRAGHLGAWPAKRPYRKLRKVIGYATEQAT